MAEIKNLVFDLGNVIIDIDYQVTVAQFQKLALIDFSEIVSYTHQNKLFDFFETGAVNAVEFRQQLRKYLKHDTTDEEIDAAWNAILINFPPAKFSLLKELKTRYRTFALSNINEIHLHSINEVAHRQFGEDSFESFFHKAYYSNLLGCRKPDEEIYKIIEAKENLNPAETFFVDDKPDNVETAKRRGWQAYLLTERDKLFDLLKELKIT